MKKLIALGLLALLLVSLVSGSFTTIPEGFRGVVLRYQSAQPNPMHPGPNFKLPFIDSVVEIDTRQQRILLDLNAISKDNQPIGFKVSINWSVEIDSTVAFYSQYGDIKRFSEVKLNPAIQQSTKDAIARFNTPNLKNRGELAETVKDILILAMTQYPITVHSIQIEDLELPPEYLAQIGKTQVANEAIKTSGFQLQTQEIVQQQKVQAAKAEADSKIEQARGDAEAVRLRAAAEADAIILKGDAQASAIKAERQALQGESYVDLKAVGAWNGVVPTHMIPQSTVPFIGISK